MENIFVDETVYPTNFSAGGINAYYVGGCETAGNRPAYCICVNKIQAYLRDKRLKDSDCEAPIRNGVCPAMQMRREELTAGKSIYFIHRDKLREHQKLAEVSRNELVVSDVAASRKKKPMMYPAYVTEAQGAARAKAAPVSSGSSVGVLSNIDDAGYSKAITAAVEKESVPKIEVREGESLLEMARRALA